MSNRRRLRHEVPLSKGGWAMAQDSFRVANAGMLRKLLDAAERRKPERVDKVVVSLDGAGRILEGCPVCDGLVVLIDRDHYRLLAVPVYGELLVAEGEGEPDGPCIVDKW